MDEGLKLVVVNRKRTKKTQMIIAFLFISKNNEYVENNEQFQVRSNHGTDSGPETDMQFPNENKTELTIFRPKNKNITKQIHKVKQTKYLQ